MQATLSVAIITLNEEDNLPRTLASVRFAQEVVVLDEHGRDVRHRGRLQHQYRQTGIRPALRKWLVCYKGEIWPTNADRMVKHIRARFNLAHDVLRHSFFSYVVGAEKSVERAALEGGNTESGQCAAAVGGAEGQGRG